MKDRTSAGDRLHSAVDVLVTALSVDTEGKRLASPEKTDCAIDDARGALAEYRAADSQQRTVGADVLAEALDALLTWPTVPAAAREGFTPVLYALEMARYQYSGASEYLDT